MIAVFTTRSTCLITDTIHLRTWRATTVLLSATTRGRGCPTPIRARLTTTLDIPIWRRSKCPSYQSLPDPLKNRDLAKEQDTLNCIVSIVKSNIGDYSGKMLPLKRVKESGLYEPLVGHVGTPRNTRIIIAIFARVEEHSFQSTIPCDENI